MRKVSFLLLLVSMFLTACEGDRVVPVGARVAFNPETKRVSVPTTKGGNIVLDAFQEVPIGATPSPSPSSSETLSVSNLRFDTSSSSLTPRFDANGVEKFDVYLNGEKKATGISGLERSYYLPNLNPDTQYRVKLDFFGKNGGRAALEQDIRTLAVGATPTPNPGVTPAPTVDSPVVTAGMTSANVRVSATNANSGNSVRIRANNADFYGQINSDIFVTGLTAGTTYPAEAFVSGPGGTTSRQFSFSTMPSGSTDKTVATYWQTRNENYTSAVLWGSREWTLDSSSEGGLKVPLSGSQNYTVRVEANNGQVMENAFTNSFVEFRPLPSNLAPYNVRVRIGSTDVLTMRIEKKIKALRGQERR